MNRPFYTDPDEAEGQEKDKKKLQEVQQSEVDDLIKIINQPAGRRLIYRWIEQMGYFKTVASSSGSQMYLNEGRRSVALEIIKELNDVDKNIFPQMQMEG